MACVEPARESLSAMNTITRTSSCCRLQMPFSSCMSPLAPSSPFPELAVQADSRGTARPGDYLRADEDEIEGFKSRLNERLAPSGNQFSGEGVNDEWQIADTIAQWWRPSFETFMYPYPPAHVTRPKECKKLFFIQLPKSSTSGPFLRKLCEG